MDPYPFKHPAIILARIRKAVEPSLVAAGFQFDGRNKPARPVYLYLDYSRPAEVLRLAWDRHDSNNFIGLTATLLGGSGDETRIAAIDLSELAHLPKRQTTPALQMRMDAFVAAVQHFLAT
jgi:hypothetical protein